ncbi:metH [Symbiodinium sp. CCMP2456]|nr:metH [Symbiodinium sp. CCMP2456]
MVSDTLNAAVYVIEEYCSMSPKDCFINVTMKEGRTASGQSLSACLASLAHAQPFAFGLTDEKARLLGKARRPMLPSRHTCRQTLTLPSRPQFRCRAQKCWPEKRS